MLANAAGVEEDNVGLPGVGDQFVAGLAQSSNDELAVEHVHLTADCLQKQFLAHDDCSLTLASPGGRIGQGNTIIAVMAAAGRTVWPAISPAAAGVGQHGALDWTELTRLATCPPTPARHMGMRRPDLPRMPTASDLSR